MAFPKKCFVLGIITIFALSSSTAVSAKSDPVNKNSNGNPTRAEIYAKALKTCKAHRGPESTVQDLHAGKKPWWAVCLFGEQPFRVMVK